MTSLRGHGNTLVHYTGTVFITIITVRKDDKSLCTDACVVRGADCGSDHHLLYLHFELPPKIRRIQYGVLQQFVFAVRYFDIHIKRCVFNACVLSLLLYDSE